MCRLQRRTKKEDDGKQEQEREEAEKEITRGKRCEGMKTRPDTRPGITRFFFYKNV